MKKNKEKIKTNLEEKDKTKIRAGMVWRCSINQKRKIQRKKMESK